MKKMVLVNIVFILFSGYSFCQLKPFINLEKQAINNNKTEVLDTIKILAVIADFQTDKDEATTGDGKYGSIYTKDYGNTIIDPLPHDKQYFEAHLQFVKNYYSKASKNKVAVVYTVLPDIITVSKTMRNYSNGSQSTDYKPLVDFSSEVWSKADSIYKNFDFSYYNTFVIFHAGVGRDVSLPGSLGIERDIPSVYLSYDNIKSYYPDFTGFKVQNNSYGIQSTMILPETESRELSSYTGSFLFQISINGLLVSSIASRLGLPDLFDTKTGLSAIGRFGLMDGQAIFAYNGLFPPLPSAWERIQLGWDSPKVVENSYNNLSLNTYYNSSVLDTTILKFPINSHEYFLTENRQRDINKDGAIVTYMLNGQTYTETFVKDTTGFYSYDIDSLKGVVTDIDEPDWALPGNGIVVWHIDDNIIQNNTPTNTINVDKNLRGVDVVEADGMQEIGEKFTTALGDIIIGEGAPEDFWYKGNDSHFYKNIFSPDSRPNSFSNDNVNSLITLKNFSEISNRMSFDFIKGDSTIKLVSSFRTGISTSPTIVAFDNHLFSFYTNNNKDVVIYQDTTKIRTLQNFASSSVSYVIKDKILYIIGNNLNNLNIFLINPDALEPFQAQIKVDNLVPSTPLLEIKNNTILATVYTNSAILTYDIIDRSLVSYHAIPVVENSRILAGNSDYLIAASTTTNNFYRFTANDSSYLNVDGVIKQLILTKDKDNKYTSVILTDNGITLYKENGEIKNFKLDIKPGAGIAIADLNKTGENNIILQNNNLLSVYNFNGIMSEGFPVKLNSYSPNSSPLAAEINNNTAILLYNNTGDFFAYGNKGKTLPGFPFSTGLSLDNVNPGLNILNNNLYLSITEAYTAQFLLSTNAQKVYWNANSPAESNNNFVDAASSENFVSDFFPVKKAYNYPNPVNSGITTIRYYVAEDSKVNIKIFDLAGELVKEFSQDAKGGYDNEVNWNIDNIQSGIYLAKINAEANNGKSGNKVIKIAVIK